MSDYRYPRTTGEAFRGADYASSLERPRASRWPRFVGWAVIALVIVSYLI